MPKDLFTRSKGPGGSVDAQDLDRIIRDLRRAMDGSSDAYETFTGTGSISPSTDYARVTTLGASIVLTLPTAALAGPGHEITIKDATGNCSTSKTITVQRAGADTIDGAASVVGAFAYWRTTLKSDGVSAWDVIEENSL